MNWYVVVVGHGKFRCKTLASANQHAARFKELTDSPVFVEALPVVWN